MDNMCPVKEKTTQVAAEMEDSKTNSIRLEELVTALEGRLSGVLMMRDGLEDKEEKPMKERVLLAGSMHAVNEETLASLTRLQSILDRLEL